MTTSKRAKGMVPLKSRIADDLILNLFTALKTCNPDIQKHMVEHFMQCDSEYETRVKEGLEQSKPRCILVKG